MTKYAEIGRYEIIANMLLCSSHFKVIQNVYNPDTQTCQDGRTSYDGLGSGGGGGVGGGWGGGVTMQNTKQKIIL